MLSQILRYTCRRALKDLGHTADVPSQILQPVDDVFKILTEAIPKPEDVLLHLCTFKPRRLKCQKMQRFMKRLEEHLSREEQKKERKKEQKGLEAYLRAARGRSRCCPAAHILLARARRAAHAPGGRAGRRVRHVYLLCYFFLLAIV